jgi:hypothetical protein
MTRVKGSSGERLKLDRSFSKVSTDHKKRKSTTVIRRTPRPAQERSQEKGPEQSDSKTKGHLAYSSDGRYFLIRQPSIDRIVELWNQETNELIATLRHPTRVSGAGFSNKSKYVHTYAGNVERVWIAATGQFLTGHRYKRQMSLEGLRRKFSGESTDVLTALANLDKPIDREYIPEILPGSQGRKNQPNNTGEQTEGRVRDASKANEILNLYLETQGAPYDKRPMLAARIRHMVASAIARESPRAQWLKERAKPDSELGMLSAPLFLKRVYADVIGSEGLVFKEFIREMDSDLMAAVDTYVSQRTGRKKDFGHARGLIFIASRSATNPRRQKAATRPNRGPSI